MTAVEWILDWMDKNEYFIGDDLLKAVQQAKQMEKQQMRTAYTSGFDDKEKGIFNPAKLISKNQKQ